MTGKIFALALALSFPLADTLKASCPNCDFTLIDDWDVTSPSPAFPFWLDAKTPGKVAILTLRSSPSAVHFTSYDQAGTNLLTQATNTLAEFLEVGQSGKYYIAANPQIIIYKADGSFESSIPVPAGFDNFQDLAVDEANNRIHVLTRQGSVWHVRTFDLLGSSLGGFAFTAPGDFDFPTSLELLSSGKLVITMASGGGGPTPSFIYTTAGVLHANFGTAGPGILPNWPRQAASFPDGRFAVAGSTRGINIYDADGNFLCSFGDQRGAGQIFDSSPRWVTVDDSGLMYVNDAYPSASNPYLHNIQVFDTNCLTPTITPTKTFTPNRRPPFLTFLPTPRRSATLTPSPTSTLTSTPTSTLTPLPTACAAGAGVIDSVAGQLPTPGFSAPSGCPVLGILATDTLQDSVRGTCTDSMGNLYIASQGCAFIYKVDAVSGIISAVVGTGVFGYLDGPAASAKINESMAVEFDAAGNLYILEGSGSTWRIRKMDTGAAVTTLATLPPGGALDMALDQLGKIFVAAIDFIYQVDIATGTVSVYAGTGVFGSSSPDGTPAASAAIHTRGVAVDASNHVHYADLAADKVRKIDRGTGLISTVAGTGVSGSGGNGGPAASAELSFPDSIGFDSAGNLFIAEQSNSWVRRVDTSPMRIIEVVAGDGTFDSDGDGGPATSAGIGFPLSISVDQASGDFFILSQDHHAVRRVYVCGVLPPSPTPTPVPIQLCSTAGSNYMTQGGFENGIGASPPLGWTNLETSATASQVPGEDREGDSSPDGVWEVQYGGPGTAASIQQTLSGLPGGNYSLSGFINRGTVVITDSIASNIELSGHGGAPIIVDVTPPVADAWQFFSQPFAVSTGTVTVKLRSACGANSGPNELWDDIRVCLVSFGPPPPLTPPFEPSAAGKGRPSAQSLGGRVLVVAPNPGNGMARAQFELEKATQRARLLVFDLNGALKKSVNLGERPAGVSAEALDLSELGPGIYFVELDADYGFGLLPRKVQKIAIVR